MPFCNQCGNQVGDADRYCGNCGAPQPPAAARTGPLPPPSDPLASMSPRTLAMLCYVPWVGWVMAVIVLGARRFRSDLSLRFHAFQGLYIFAAWLLLDWVVVPIFNAMPSQVFRLDHLLQVLIVGVWIFMIVKTRQGEAYSLPLVGELAHRSAQERNGV